MTALRAHLRRREKGAAAAQPRDPAPVAADVVSMKHTTRPGADPIPNSLSAPRPVRTTDGTRLMAGLTWEIASGPETPVIRPNAPLVLRLADRRARLARAGNPAATGFPTSSLLLAMGDLLARSRPGISGPWAFLADLPGPGSDPEDPLIWLGFADLVATGTPAAETPSPTLIPRPGTEQMFQSTDTALAALQQHLATTEIAGIGTMWLTEGDSNRGRLQQHLAHIAPTLPVEEVALDTALDDLPRFVPPRRIPAKVIAGLGGGIALLLAGAFVVIPMVEAAFETPPPPPPERVSVRIEDGAFAAACTTALDGWWPRVVGWQPDSAGCALAGHLPDTPVLPDLPIPARLLHPMVVWHHLAPAESRNAVLAHSAAEQMIESWPHEAQISPEGLTFWQVVSLPMGPVKDGAPPPPDPDAVRARLSALWADRPEAVAGDGPQFVITPGAHAAPGELFDRAGRVPGIAPVRLVRDSRETGAQTLVLIPARSRTVPVTMIEAPIKTQAETNAGSPTGEGKP